MRLAFCRLICIIAAASACVRRPTDETSAEKTPGANGFNVRIAQYPRNDSLPAPEGYVPGEYYTVVLQGWKTRYTVQTFRGFSLIAVGANTEDANHPIGSFQVRERGLFQWSQQCYHGVSHSSLQPKTEVEVVWQAPAMNAGCVAFKATVLEYKDVWYMDDGALTKKFCPLTYRRSVNDQAGPALERPEECCACDEAKYEMIFEGHWSRQTHPKDFPTLEHLTHFSDIVGASHSDRYTMWMNGAYATDGMKQLAEWGDTTKYEEELKDKGREVRTIIKARGLWFPNVQGTAKAMFRTDKYHHLISLASMLGPSPDWIVGISSVNLCLKNCSWVNERSFDLEPWDAGTDSGITYMAPNNPTIPWEKIKPITTRDPDDPRNPFYNPSSDRIPPLAKLTIRREKVYPMECKDVSFYAQAGRSEDNAETSEDLEYKDRRECSVGSWTPWSICSASCGKGLRMRSRLYKNAVKAQMGECKRQINEKQFCNADISVCAGSDAFNDMCTTTAWSEWTDCSVKCGKGMRVRNRNYDNPMVMKKCYAELMEKEMCIGDAGEDCNAPVDPDCQTTKWSEWSPCSHSCGEGARVRTRLFFHPDKRTSCRNTELLERQTCKAQSCESFLIRHAEEICKEAVDAGQCQGTFPRYYYDSASKTCRRFVYTGCRGNRNNFESEEFCRKACVKSKNGGGDEDDDDANRVELNNEIDSSTKKPADKPTTTVYLPDAEHLRLPSNSVMQRMAYALNVYSLDSYLNLATGMVCVPANSLASALGIEEANDGGPAVDCMVTEWSTWSECTSSCGKGVRQRTRMIKVPPRNGGHPCPRDLLQKTRCRLRPCPSDCKMTPWSDWSPCSATCGSGYQMRQRHRRPPYSSTCPPNQVDKRVCDSGPCFRRTQ